MTDLRKAAEMALEALELSYPRFGLATEKYKQAIKALRQALAEPEPWVKTYASGKPNYCAPVEREDLVTNLANPVKNFVKREEKNT